MRLISFCSCVIFSVNSFRVFMMLALSSGFIPRFFSRRFIKAWKRCITMIRKCKWLKGGKAWLWAALPSDIQFVSLTSPASSSSCPVGALMSPEIKKETDININIRQKLIIILQSLRHEI